MMVVIDLLPRADTSASSAQTGSIPPASSATISNPQAEDSSTSSVDIRTGIGIGLAIAAFLIFFVLGIVWFLMRRHKRRKGGGRRSHDNEQRGTFDSVGSTLVRSRNSIPLQNLHEVHGKSVRRGSEMMTPANSHEVSALPPTRNGQPAEMPTIWNEGYRGRRGTQIRRDSEFTVRVSEDGQTSERPDSEATVRSKGASGSEEDARYTFLLD